MNCHDVDILLDSRLGGGPDAARQRELDEHLKTCSRCRFKLGVLDDCRTLDEGDEVPAAFSAAWRQRITQEEAVPVKQFPKLIKWVSIAAALVVLVGGTYLTRQARIMKGGLPAPEPGYAGNVVYSASPESREMLGAAPQSSAYAADADMAVEKSRESSPEKIIRAAELSLSSREFDKDHAAILAAVRQAGGRVENANLSNSYGSLRTVWLTLRVPVDKLDSVIESLKGVGRLVSFSESAQDVSEQYADTENRLKTQQTKMERLQALLQRAGTLEDLIAVESSISDTQYEIDRLTGSLRGLDSKVDYATLSVTLNELGPIETSQNQDETLWERVRNGMAAAFEGLVSLLSDLLVFLVIALPYAAVLLVLILIIRYIIKRRKNK